MTRTARMIALAALAAALPAPAAFAQDIDRTAVATAIPAEKK